MAIDGNFDAALRIVRELAERADHPVTLVNSVNPHRLEGQKTAAFEVCDDLGRAPDVLAIPVGNAGNISAYWAGFGDYRAAGLIDGLPRMYGFQAAGAAPIVLGHRVAEPETIATAIRIGDPASWTKAVAARDESGGRIEAVTDDEILEAYRDVARDEGDLLRAVVGGRAGRGPAAGDGWPARGPDRRDDRVRPDRQRPQGPDDRRGAGRRVHRVGGDDGGGHGRPGLVGRCPPATGSPSSTVAG